jgi:hypothetical protein
MNKLIVKLTLTNGVHYMSDPAEMDEDDVKDVMQTLNEALSGEPGVFTMTCSEKTVLIRNDAILSASFDYTSFDEDSSYFAGA